MVEVAAEEDSEAEAIPTSPCEKETVTFVMSRHILRDSVLCIQNGLKQISRAQ